MTLTTTASCMVSSILTLLTFSGMQMLKPFLVSSRIMTILGGFLGSIFYLFFLTALGNLCKALLGKQQLYILECVVSMIVAVAVSGSVHRVSATSSIIFCSATLYFLNGYSKEVYSSTQTPIEKPVIKKKK